MSGNAVDNDSQLHIIRVMYICLCQGVTDHDIKRAIDNGATSFRDIQDTLGVATQCGSCELMARSVMKEAMPVLSSDQYYDAIDSSLALA